VDAAHRRTVTVAVMLGMFLAALDTTIVATALPTITRVLNGFSLYPWVAASYSLTMTAGTPVFGRLADRYGRRRVYLFGIAAFLVGSALCGAARSMPELVVFRAIQGIGAGALLPIALTIVGDLYTLEERARIQGLFSGVWGIASIAGPLLGGLIVAATSWRWIFYVNVPVGLLALWIVARRYRECSVARGEPVDGVGALLFIAAVVVLLLALEGGRVHGPLALLAATLGAAFVLRERTMPDPILPLGLFRNRIVSVTSASGLLVGAALFGSLYYIPLFVQGVEAGTATEAGLTLTPLMLAWTGASILGGRLVIRFGFRPVATVGIVLLGVGFGILSRLHPGMGSAWVGCATILLGTGMGLTVLTFVLAVQTSVGYEQRGLATSLTLFFRNVGGAVGVSLLGNLLFARLQAEGVPLHRVQAVLDPIRRTTLPPGVLEAARDALASGVGGVFLVSLGLALCALLCVRLLPTGRPEPATSLAPAPGE
jgi:EmrB/QacA subfamily drug resistance transporter